MSDQTAQSGTTPVVSPPPVPRPSLAQRIEEIGKLKGVSHKKAVVQRGVTKVKSSAGEKLDRMKAVLSGTKEETDYVRRHTRLTDSLETYAANPLMTEAVATAKKELAKLPSVPVAKPKPGKEIDWATPYVELGKITDALVKAASDSQDQEKAAASDPATKNAMLRIKTAREALGERMLPEHELTTFTKLFDEKAAMVVKGEHDMKSVEKQIEADLLNLDKAIRLAAGIVQRAMDKHAELSRRLASSELDEDKRLAVASLLSAGEAAARAYDEQTATAKLNQAEQALGPQGGKGGKGGAKLPTAAEVLASLGSETQGLTFDVNKLVQAVGLNLDGNGKKPVYDELIRLQTSIDSVRYMLDKGGDAVAGDAKRMVEGLKGQYAKLAPAATFDRSALDVAKKNFDKTCKPVEKEASDFYTSCGQRSNYIGAFHLQITELKTRLATSAQTAQSEADLNLAQLERELASIQKAIATGDRPSPEQLAYDSIAGRFGRRAEKLERLAAGIMKVDSELGVTLGLVGAPAQLRREGEQYTKSTPAPGDLAKATQGLRAVVAKYDEKITQIENAPKAAPPTADELRRDCQQLKTAYDQRLLAVIALIDADAKKNVVMRELQADQLAGLQKYGAELQKQLRVLAGPSEPGATTDKALLADTKTALTGFAASVTKFEQMGPGPNHVKGKKHFDDVTKLAEKNLKLLGHARFAKRPEVVADWRTTLEGIKKAPTKGDPDATYQSLEQMRLAIDAALVEAEREYGQAKQERDAVEKLLDIITLPKDPALQRKVQAYGRAFAQLARELEQEMQRIDATEKPSPDALNALKTDFDKMTGPGEGDLVTKEQEARASDKEYEAALANLKQLIAVDIKLLREQASTMGGTPGKEMGKQLDSAEKAARLAISNLKQSHDAAAATDIFDSITTRLRTLEDSPQGNKTNGRNQLKNVEGLWRSAVGAIHSRLEELPAKVKASCAKDGVDGDQVESGLRSTLVEPVKALFVEDAFKSVIARMVNADESGFLDAREDGLAEVRRLRRTMLADPRVRLASVGCPFKEAQVSFRAIENVLLNLETSFNISDTVE